MVSVTLGSMTSSETENIVARRAHMPAPGKHVPISTYRLQLSPDFTFADAQNLVPYLQRLGVTDIYCSPILQAAPGSMHGYDVVDHTNISAALGGREGFEKLADAAHEAGLGVVVDVVPNHMAVPTPLYLNRALWSVLRDGAESPFSAWFDIDITSAENGILLPVLGERIGTVLAKGQITLDQMMVPGFEAEGEQHVLRYFDHVFPVRKNTDQLPIIELLERQYYRLAYWKVAEEELNYRRFFDVDTLAAIRVEDPEVFFASHSLLLDLYHKGYIDAFRIDHPDGLSDPRQYMARLYEATDGAWIAGEKILEGDEELPSDWKVAGCTGYEVSWRIGSVLTDPVGARSLTAQYVELSGTTDSYANIALASKKQIVNTSLHAELERLTGVISDICNEDLRLRDHSRRSIREALAALVVNLDRYRAYVVPGEKASALAESVVTAAAARARQELNEDRQETLDVVVDIVLGHEIGSASKLHDDARNEAIVRFQQLCGPVMAKGIEDTAFYRYTPLTSATEVGSDPLRANIDPDALHAWAERMGSMWPAMMSTLTTHDTKRGEDVRAQIATLTEFDEDWLALLTKLRARHAAARPAQLDGQIENLLWQTIIGTYTDRGPIEIDRLLEYLTKAAREQKTWTTWTAPDEEGETGLFSYARDILSNPETLQDLAAWRERTLPALTSRILAQKTLSMTLVGVADTYQGEEITRNILVDPDNRRPVDFQSLQHLLEELDARGSLPGDASLDEQKLWVTSRILHLRRRRPDTFVSSRSGYTPLPSTTGHAIAFARTLDDVPDVVVVTDRLRRRLEEAGGWRDATVVLPAGAWRSIFNGSTFTGGPVKIADLLKSLPVAVLEKVEDTATAEGSDLADAKTDATTEKAPAAKTKGK